MTSILETSAFPHEEIPDSLRRHRMNQQTISKVYRGRGVDQDAVDPRHFDQVSHASFQTWLTTDMRDGTFTNYRLHQIVMEVFEKILTELQLRTLR
ncbi:hypothetical protein KOR42_47570 [Thalassoglobus neptunius]|uniref:Uncharacterized protein n=1 Tax=Thalassoglobus neptunius TaxID=1938619 RepID=A0A5C5VS74_9PLAN|nr:hypothetical protein KOR42_47570 [Thalassoglobus neptunius]